MGGGSYREAALFSCTQGDLPYERELTCPSQRPRRAKELIRTPLATFAVHTSTRSHVLRNYGYDACERVRFIRSCSMSWMFGGVHDTASAPEATVAAMVASVCPPLAMMRRCG